MLRDGPGSGGIFWPARLVHSAVLAEAQGAHHCVHAFIVRRRYLAHDADADPAFFSALCAGAGGHVCHRREDVCRLVARPVRTIIAGTLWKNATQMSTMMVRLTGQ